MQSFNEGVVEMWEKIAKALGYGGNAAPTTPQPLPQKLNIPQAPKTPTSIPGSSPVSPVVAKPPNTDPNQIVPPIGKK